MNSGLIEQPSNPFGNPPLDVAPEVRAALAAGRPVVALESTIISHGMPYPQNVATALQVEGEVRAHGAVPATIAVVDGRLKLNVVSSSLGKLALPEEIVERIERPLQARLDDLSGGLEYQLRSISTAEHRLTLEIEI